MGLTSAYAAGYRARTKVYRGTVDVKMLLFDPLEGGWEIDDSIRSFQISEPFLQDGAEVSILEIAEDSKATAIKLATCEFQIDGEFYKVKNRSEPLGANKRLWKFRIERTKSE